MKQSEIYAEELKAAEKAWDEACQRKYRKGISDDEKKKASEEVEKWYQEKLRLEIAVRAAKNQELEVGDGCTYHLWSDAYACTVIKKTAKTITVQRDKATLDPSFKPKFVTGGFSAHCTNNNDQSYTYERDESGNVYKLYWHEKTGRWQNGSGSGAFVLTVGRHEFYDYNF